MDALLSQIIAGGEKVALVLSLVEGIKGIFGTDSEKALQKRKSKVLRALRTIRFNEKGVLELLSDLSKSKTVSETRSTRILRSFDDVEWKVQSALLELNFEELIPDFQIPLKTARSLDNIRLGKISVRDSVKNLFLGGILENEGKLSRAQVTALDTMIDRIRKLNRTIDNIEIWLA